VAVAVLVGVGVVVDVALDVGVALRVCVGVGVEDGVRDGEDVGVDATDVGVALCPFEESPQPITAPAHRRNAMATDGLPLPHPETVDK
jgi:hypothetical protein